MSAEKDAKAKAFVAWAKGVGAPPTSMLATAAIQQVSADARAYFDAAKPAEPVLRWVGAKRWLVPLARTGIMDVLAVSKGRYYEPFLGGASMALALGVPNMVLSDVCHPLVVTYQVIAKDPKSVLLTVEKMVSDVGGEINKKTYYDVRDLRPTHPMEVAARFIILNATCFNGVYRENKAGIFNVPYGMRTQKNLPKLEQYMAVAGALRTSIVRVQDFRVTVANAKPGDFIFADPPYLDVYSDYHKGGFTLQDHLDLAEGIKAAADRGVHVLVTNSDCKEVRDMYRWTHIFASMEPRKVNRNGAGRADVGCVLVTNTPTVIKR